MAISIITGYTGTRHITPAMDADVWRGIVGQDSYLIGANLAMAVTGTNTLSITASGAVSIQGRMGSLEPENLTFDSCPAGHQRIDLVVARYTADTSTNIEAMAYAIIKGTEVTGENPQVPAHNTGRITEGATVVDFPLGRLTYNGTAAPTITMETGNTLDDIDTIMDGTDGANAKLDQYMPGGILKVEHGGTGVNASNVPKNQVFASPNGAAGAPSFRALVADDLPVVPVAKGGTGANNTAQAKVNLNICSSGHDFRLQNMSGAAQIWGLRATGINSNNSTRGTHDVCLFPTNTGVGFYDFTSGGSIWNADFANRAPNTFFSGPASGDSNALATWRKLVAADIPGLSASKITAGTIGEARLPKLLGWTNAGCPYIQSVGANATVTLTLGVTNPSGYTPISLYGISITTSTGSAHNLALVKWWIESGTIQVFVRNPTSTAITISEVWLGILSVRSAVLENISTRISKG